MAVYDVLPSSILTDSDIRDTLRAGGGVVDFDSRSWYKPEANINMWSKYKPVILNEPITSGIPHWWKAGDGKCGFKFTVSTNKSNIYNGGNWVYEPPTGGSDSPLRSADFRGYSKAATLPPFYIELMHGETILLDLNNDLNVLFDVLVNTLGKGTNLLTTDIEPLNGYYPCVLLYRDNNTSNVPYIATSNLDIQNLSEKYHPIRIPLSRLTDQPVIYGAYLCLRSRRRFIEDSINGFAPDEPDTKYIPFIKYDPMNYGSKAILNIRRTDGGGGTSGIQFYVDSVSNLLNGVYNSLSYHLSSPLVSSGGLFANLTLYNTTSSAVSISTSVGASTSQIKMKLRLLDGSVSTGETTMYVNDAAVQYVTIPANGHVVVKLGSNDALIKGLSGSGFPNKEYTTDIDLSVGSYSYKANNVRIDYRK